MASETSNHAEWLQLPFCVILAAAHWRDFSIVTAVARLQCCEQVARPAHHERLGTGHDLSDRNKGHL